MRITAGWRPERDACEDGCMGWAIFNDGEIQRCDACDRFEDDDQAQAHALFVFADLVKPSSCKTSDAERRHALANLRGLWTAHQE